MSDIARSEAIKQLRLLKADITNGLSFVSKTKDKHKALKSLDMAISSLETDEAYQLMEEQPEFCEDCISRNAVMDMIIEYRDSLADTGKKDALERAYGANYVGMKIADMPSVLPKTDKPTIIDWNNCHTSEQLDSISTTKNDLGVDCISRADAIGSIAVECSAEKLDIDYSKFLMLRRAIKALPTVTPQESRWIPVSEKYEHHIDHTDCIWYGNDSGCPVTCSQYRDGWNDAMDYIFKNGDGYCPYRRNENG